MCEQVECIERVNRVAIYRACEHGCNIECEHDGNIECVNRMAMCRACEQGSV